VVKLIFANGASLQDPQRLFNTSASTKPKAKSHARAKAKQKATA
jgi:hypothetical protein